MMRTHSGLHRGFTLVEMIVVIVITGIIGGMVAMFIRAPVQGYVDSARRAEMSDIADTALRRIARDVHTAVPNSLRIPNPSGSIYFEFLPTKDGGRYRVADIGAGGCGASGNDLDFTAQDTCFEIVGSAMDLTANDAVVIGSTQSDGNTPYQPEAAASGVRRAITVAGVAMSFVRMTSPIKLPDSAELEGHRFEIVPTEQEAVTYACTGTLVTLDGNGDGQGALVRYWKYGFRPSQPIPPIAGAAHGILANYVSDCHFVYETANARNSLLAIRLTITRGGESVNLYHEIQVNNIP
jgi:MSHA biogenesis protein MshO